MIQGLKEFAEFSQRLKDQAEAAKVDAEVAKELRKAEEAREVRLREDLQSSKELNRRLEAQVKDLKEKLAIEKTSMSELKVKFPDVDSRRKIAKKRVEALKAKVKATQLAINKVVEEYKKSENFKLEVVSSLIISDF